MATINVGAIAIDLVNNTLFHLAHESFRKPCGKLTDPKVNNKLRSLNALLLILIMSMLDTNVGYNITNVGYKDIALCKLIPMGISISIM